MAIIKNFQGFDNKDDIFELIDKFDKSSLFELEISMAYPDKAYPVEREIKIKMVKLSKESKQAAYRDIDEDDFGDIPQDDISIIKMTKSQDFEDIKDTKDIKNTDKSGKTINAPLIGTFYSSPSPDAEPYVKNGDKIEKGAVVCIIEAMKNMNEIESEADGEIVEILVQNGDTVEFGQPLFRLK